MKKKTRDKLVNKVLNSLRHDNDAGRRVLYAQVMGTLVFEWKTRKRKEVEDFIAKIS